MTNEQFEMTAWSVLIVAVALVVGIVATAVNTEMWEKDAVANGKAEYNSISGDWQWKK